MSPSDQLPLFEVPPERSRMDKGDVAPLDPGTPLYIARDFYVDALQRGGASIYTVKAFKSDIGLLAQWAGEERAIGDLGTRDLNQFLNWMQDERGVPCSPKTYARRITALKHFFGYLFDIEAIAKDPSNAVIQHTVAVALPEVLSEDEVNYALEAAHLMRIGKVGEGPDARPYLLLLLLLETAIKKGEAVALGWEHIEREHPDGARLWIRYANAKLRYKERPIPISEAWLELLEQYAYQYKKKGDTIFSRTARMLEYVLRDIAQVAQISASRLSFETIRWTAALRDYRAGMPDEQLREKLGISRITWAKTSERLAGLARADSEETDF